MSVPLWPIKLTSPFDPPEAPKGLELSTHNTQMRRRQIIAGLSVGLSVGLAGCSIGFGPDTGSVSAPTDTPPEEHCEPASELRPQPDSSRTKPYPALPDFPTAADSSSFATTYERAYQFNSRLPEYRSIQVDLSVPEWAVSETENGYVIGIDGRVQFDQPKTPTSEATARPSGFFEYAVWYFVTERFAIRGQSIDGSLEKGDAPGFAGAVPVVCDSA